MIVPDANLLLYAYDAASPFHPAAAAWWSDCLSGSEPVGLCPAVLFAFVRIGTSGRAFVDPMTVQEAAAHVEKWLDQPVTQLLDVEIEDIRSALGMLRGAGAGGNLTTDAQLASLALRHRAVVHTADSDFARFPEVRWHNPLFPEL
ncbi:MAG: PIN domain-containing protein [Verrucomicrobiae bacterium]|nr:PIN domain-containing protein [Verrucomicrobiae bacterium]